MRTLTGGLSTSSPTQLPWDAPGDGQYRGKAVRRSRLAGESGRAIAMKGRKRSARLMALVGRRGIADRMQKTPLGN
jgi:hypothetical protein